MKRFGQYGEKLSNKNYLEMRLLVRPYSMPNNFQGNVKLWVEKPWVNILTYRYKDGRIKIEPTSVDLSFDKIDNHFFNSNQIVFEPC